MGNCFPFGLHRRRKEEPLSSLTDHHTLELASRPAKVLSAASGSLGRAQARINHLKAKHGTPTDVAGVSIVDSPLQRPVEVEGEIIWRATVLLGSPPIAIMLDLDTASSDLVLEPGMYLPEASKTSRDSGKPFQISYGDGTMASGQVFVDHASMAGLSTPSQAIACVAQTTLPGRESAGTLGLGFQSIAQTNSMPLLDSIYQTNRAGMRDLFALSLWDPSGGGGAFLDIGWIDRDKYEGDPDLAWGDVDDSAGFWSIDFMLNGAAASKAIVDTATTLIVGPADQVRKILEAANFRIVQQGNEVFGLWHQGETQPIILTFGGREFELSQEALTFQTEGTLTVCSIVGTDMGSGSSWILGTSFFRDVYAVFDKGNTRIGFAARKRT